MTTHERDPRCDVCVIVLTRNRKAMLAHALAALAAQTRRPDLVIVVDNASTDGTADLVLRGELAAGNIPLRLLALTRNAGCSEGYVAGLSDAITHDHAWIWLIEDDTVPAPDALEQLLGAPQASSPWTVALASALSDPDGRPLYVPRGRLRRRLGGTPCVALPEAAYRQDAARIEYFGYLGSLIRTSAIRDAGLPRREMFMWIDDVEFSWRLTRIGAAYLIPGSRVVHADTTLAHDAFATSLLARLRQYARPTDFASTWKNAYGLRNLVAFGRESGLVSLAHAIAYTLFLIARSLIFERDARIARARVFATMFRHGRAGRFLNVAAERWPELRGTRRPGAFLAREHLRYSDALPASVAVERAVVEPTT